MKELVTDAQFAVVFGVVCALWTAAWGLWWAIARKLTAIVVAAAGPAAYLLWIAYCALAPVLNITCVSGVLVLTVLFAAAGCAFGIWLSRAGARS